MEKIADEQNRKRQQEIIKLLPQDPMLAYHTLEFILVQLAFQMKVKRTQHTYFTNTYKGAFRITVENIPNLVPNPNTFQPAPENKEGLYVG